MREARDRRGRATRGGAGLLEREEALRAIDELLAASREGGDHALLIVGHAGMGKTRLHEAALDRARARRRLVLRAAGAELEQNLAFGVAGQLLRALLQELPASERPGLLADIPEQVRLLHGAEPAEPGVVPGDELPVSHGLFTLLAEALQTRPAFMAIDDLHWCDGPSLQLLLYLLHRLPELPLALLLTRRPVASADEDDERLDHISAHPRVRLQELSPLGPEAVRKLVTGSLGDRAEPGLAEVCHEATAGNPFFVHELLLALAAEPGLDGAQLTKRARALAPDAVTRSLRVRVGRLGAAAAALSRAVAILGDDVPLRQAAALAGLQISQAALAADALAAAEVLLAREPLRFVHPLVRHSIELDIPASERSGRHLDAARLLHAEGEGPERVAAHLLVGRAEGSAWAVEQLRAAAADAMARAGTISAIRYLERALQEPPPAEERGEVLAELGRAEAAAGRAAAVEHLEAAAATAADPRERAGLALERARALYAQGRHRDAAAAFEEGLMELGADLQDPQARELHDQLQTGFVATASIVPDLQSQAIERSQSLLGSRPSGPPTQGQRLLMAQAAVQAAFAGEPAPTIAALAEQAWDEGRMLATETSDGVGWSLLTAAFCLAGELERSLEIADAALEDARRRGAPLAFATASYVRGLPGLWRGHVTAAMADLELARDARRYGWRQFPRAAAGFYAMCLVERGELDAADAVLAEDGSPDPPGDLEDVLRLYALSELRLRQGRSEDALATALTVGEWAERTVPFLGYCPWRGVAAQAALALGDQGRAQAFAAEALERAEGTQVLHLRIRALRVAGMCQGGDEGLVKLGQAVELGQASPPRLETIYALIELGAALRRRNDRAAGRPPLQHAADLAFRCGAVALHERARVELSATGARPRRDGLLTGPSSLTPSERRIAELAAQGRSNREIAAALFVTPKTVEYHLRNVYRKLGIETRRQLAGALED